MRILQFNDQAVRVRTDLSRALASLERQSLMGQSSFNSFDICSLTDNNSSGATLYQASLEDDNRYQALAVRGEAGQLLAEYQQQRVETRRQAVDQYVDTYYQLARRFASEVDPDWDGDFSAERTSLQQLIEDPDSGQPLVGNEHRITDNAVDRDQVLAFMQQHSFEITQVRQLYRELKESPAELEGWLQQQGISLSAEMDAALDATRYNNALPGDNTLATLTTHVRVVGASSQNSFQQTGGDLQLGAAQRQSRGATRDLWLANRLDQRQQSLKIPDTYDLSRQIFFNETSPEQIAQRDQRISEINQLQQQLGSQVAQRFSLGSTNEHFSLQDMVANLIANRPVSSLNDGSAHPQATEIEQFYTQHRSQIDRYRDLAQRSQQAVDKSGLRIIANPLGPGIGYERLRENIEARLQTQSRSELLASIDDPRLAQQVQRYFDTDGFTQMARPEARRPPLWRPPVRPPMPEQTAFSVHGPQPPRSETPPDSPDTLLNSIRDPLIKAALAQFLRP